MRDFTRPRLTGKLSSTVNLRDNVCNDIMRPTLVAWPSWVALSGPVVARLSVRPRKKRPKLALVNSHGEQSSDMRVRKERVSLALQEACSRYTMAEKLVKHKRGAGGFQAGASCDLNVM